MAHTLKLNIWKIKLGTIPWTKNAKNQHLFDKILATSQKTDPFIAFLDAYIKSFNGKFKENIIGSKSFAPISSEIRTKSNSNLIYGFIEGGITGMVQKVKPNKNSGKAPVPVSKDEVVAQDHFFLLWIPPDVNYMYLMLQSYKTAHGGLAGPFFEHLDFFLRKFDFHIGHKEPKVPKSIKNIFKDHAIIVGMDIIKERNGPTDRSKFNPGLVDAEGLKFVFSVSGLRYSFKKFSSIFKKDQKGNPFFIDLSAIGITNPNDYIAKVNYKDPTTGSQTSASLTDLLNIRPAIVIPDSVKIKGLEKPDISEICQFCIKHLQELKLEDNYSTIDVFKDKADNN